MSREVFLDTSYLIARINPRDAHHATSIAAVEALAAVRFVTTEAVFAELLAYYAAAVLRPSAIAAVDELRANPHCRIFHFGRTGFEAALRRYRARPDKSDELGAPFGWLCNADSSSARSATSSPSEPRREPSIGAGVPRHRRLCPRQQGAWRLIHSDVHSDSARRRAEAHPPLAR